MKQPDRLGDAIRELVRAMAGYGKDRLRLHVVTPDTRAIYEIRLICSFPRGGQRDELARLNSADIIETEAFGPAPQGARQMADNSKE